MIQSRQLDIIRLILNQDSYITISEIAQQIGVSNRTIRNDLDRLEPILNDSQLKLVKKTGVGITIEGDPELKLHLFNTTKYHKNPTEALSPLERHNYIILRILTKQETRVLDLCDELYVSKSTIQKDLNTIREICQSYRLEFKRLGNQGLFIEGNERYIRNMMFTILVQSPGKQTLEKIVHTNNYNCKGDLIFPGIDLIDDEIVDGLNLLLSESPELYKLYNINGLTQVIIRYMITILRSHRNFNIELSPSFIQELSVYKDEYNLSYAMLSKQNFETNYQIKDVEVRYFQVYVIAYHQEINLSSNEHIAIEQFTQSLIAYWSEHSTYDFSNDSRLYTELFNHLKSVDIRLNYGIPIDNPLMIEINTYYHNTFDLVKESLQAINHPFWLRMSDDEIGYLALYLASAIERQKQPLKALLITETGRSSQSILQQRLAFNISEIKVIDMINLTELESVNLEQFDIVLTTVPIHKNIEQPIYQIDSFISDENLLMLKRSLRHSFKKKNSPKRT